MVVCRVALLDGTTFEPKGIDKNSLGSVVYEKVTKHLDVIESDYFGLTYRDKSGKKYWLDNTKKISKQVKGGTWVFEFQVKFYPPDPQALKEDVTRYQLCLQLRVDIFNGKLPCSFNTYALLGSYTVQSELGDHDHVENGKGIEYLNDFDFAPTQTAELLEKILELHKHHKGQTPTVAEAHFLENAKKLAMYGVDMHDVKDSDNKDLSLGVCASGLLIYKDRLRINRFVWPKILKLSYKRNSFYIKIRPGEFEPHERTIGFKCENHKLAKRLWKTCVEHHAFFRLKDADAPSSSTLFPRFNTRFRYSGRTAHQARQAAEQQTRDEPHIARTAERRSMVGHDKSKSADNIKKPHDDENDRYDQKGVDPNATAGYGQDSMSDPYASAQYQGKPGDDAADKYDQMGAEPSAEGPPGYIADSSLVSDGGKKSKKEKEEEKKRKKEEEKRKKEEEKERKRLEKELKKGQGKHKQEIDDPALLEQLKEDYMQLLRETPDITSRSQLKEVEDQLKYDPRYMAVDSDSRRQEWFDEYVDKMLKDDFMRLLRETPSITSQSTWNDAKQEIDLDPRYQAVPTDAQREEWFNEYVQNMLKSEYMDLLRETPSIHSQSSWQAGREYIQYDPRFMAVPSETQREGWFDEYIQNLKKDDFMQLLAETPDITSYSRYNDVKEELSNDPRFQNVDTEAQREAYFNEYTQDLKKAGYQQLLQDTPDITRNSKWAEAKILIDTDPRYHAVDSDLQRAKWFNDYVNDLAGRGYYGAGGYGGGYGAGYGGYGAGGESIGNYKSIDRKQEYLPITPPTVTVRTDSKMPFFEPPVESEAEAAKRKPPPVAKKPRVASGYDSEEDRLRTADVPVTVETESYKYNPDSNDVPKSTSNIPIVETKTHKVTYEKDGVPYETEDTILISSQSVTTKTQTIDTTTYKTERDGVMETHMTTKITVTTDEDDELDHDAMLRAAIERVTNMNPDISVEKIVCMRQIEEVNGEK